MKEFMIAVLLFIACIAIDFSIIHSELPEWFKMWWFLTR